MNKFPDDTTYTRIATPLGDMILAATARGLLGMWFHDQRHLPEQLKDFPRHLTWPRDDANAHMQLAASQLAEYFRAERRAFTLEFDLRAGTPFQQSVWRALLDIPQGRTESYAQLAQRIGKPAAVRAVGAAVGRNPLSVTVPCHRVLGKDGSLTGYAGGLARKTALLRLEQAIPA